MDGFVFFRLLNVYCSDLQMFAIFMAEKLVGLQCMQIVSRPETAISALAELCKVLTIFLTTPVGSVSCERSFSALRRLKLWTRSSMTEERLSGLAMMLIHRGTNYNANCFFFNN